MANTICLPKELEQLVECIGMSNGLTSVFLDVLVLSGSVLAESNREKEIIIWLAQQDQSVVGIGTVGFDIDEMPWTVDSFHEEKQFMLNAIDNAINGLGWERLDYEPHSDFVINCLNRFKLMIEVFEQKHIVLENYLYWSEIEEGDDYPSIPVGYPKCDKHLVYLSCTGVYCVTILNRRVQ